jgi:hypothetical protein
VEGIPRLIGCCRYGIPGGTHRGYWASTDGARWRSRGHHNLLLISSKRNPQDSMNRRKYCCCITSKVCDISLRMSCIGAWNTRPPSFVGKPWLSVLWVVNCIAKEFSLNNQSSLCCTRCLQKSQSQLYSCNLRKYEWLLQMMLLLQNWNPPV